MKISKKRYIQGFCLVVIFLAIVRSIFPSVAENGSGIDVKKSNIEKEEKEETKREGDVSSDCDAYVATPVAFPGSSRFFNSDGSLVKNRIYSVPHFGNAFPDQNDVQLAAAEKYGVQPVANRKDAERRMSELVYIGSNPFYHVDKLKNSIPYLVPKASVLLQDIGRSFFDSLQIKGVPLHKIIVTSVLRSREDVEKLRGHNGNATQNSCHMYGTTFDICYNRYKTVTPPGESRRAVRNDTLKWILSEVLNDMRQQQRCLVKYEIHQGCFHITVN